MPRRPPPPPSLGACIRHRREQLQLDQTEAARRTGVSRSTWIRWENDTIVPDEESRIRLEAVLEWEPGSVAGALAGRAPTPLRQPLATVTPLRADTADASPVDGDLAELVGIWRDVMRLPDAVVQGLIEDFRADKAGADADRRERFLRRAREAGG